MNDQPDIIPGTSGSATLFAKMARVMGKMSRIKKTGYNKAQSYAFATESDVVDMVREAMAEEKLAFFVDIIEMKSTPRGEKMTHWIGHFMFTFADAETGATRSCEWMAEAAEYGDKGINKVATAAVKYFLLKTFLISTGDVSEDADSESPELQKPAKVKSSGNGGTSHPQRPAPPATGFPIPENPAPSANGGNHDAPAQPKTKVVQMNTTADTDDISKWELWTPLMTNQQIKALYPDGTHRANVIKLLKRNGAFANGAPGAAVWRIQSYHKMRADNMSEDDAVAATVSLPDALEGLEA